MEWRVLADIVAALHAAYVGFVVLGFAAVLAGGARGWRWVRNFYFRAAHLAAILFVCVGALAGWACALTTLEDALRRKGGEAGYARDFIGYWLDWLIFYNAPARVFAVTYLGFAVLVLGTLWLVPPRWPGERGKGIYPR